MALAPSVRTTHKHHTQRGIERLALFFQPLTWTHPRSAEHADFEGIERLALVLGGEIVSTFDHPEKVKLGTCELVEEIMIGEDRVIRFSGVQLGEACTVVLRGGSSQMLEEAERSLHDALCVVNDTVRQKRIVFGGGAAEMEMAQAVEELAAQVRRLRLCSAARSTRIRLTRRSLVQTAGKQALALEAFARALRAIPTILADNAGLDSAELVSQMRAAHAKGNRYAGLDVLLPGIGNMKELGITESHHVKHQILVSASEAAEMLLRVDNIIKTAPRKREEDPRYC